MSDLAGYIFTGIVLLIVGYLSHYLQPKSKVVSWMHHRFLFDGVDITDPPVTFATLAYTIQNVGRKAAEDIEIVHKSKPNFFKLEPVLNYEQCTTPSGEHVVKIPSLGPKEFFTIEYLVYRVPIPELLHIRSKDGPSAFINIQPTRIFPKWFQLAVGFFLFVGIGFSAYWLIMAVIFISKGIGIS
ncbi:MAG: hypothetical protein Q8O10_06240 [candidate division Zixibacteria bacterium]|nr:hypothetical protein [candidate division Zixibacteria bacterium]